MKKRFFTLLLSLIAGSVFAQDDQLFGPAEQMPVAKKGVILTGNASLDIPGGDMAKRFGWSYRVGPGILYKTESNWLFGAKFDFILGREIRQDSLMINIRDKYPTQSRNVYEFIDNTGQRVGIPVFERGYAVGLSVGRIFAFSDLHPDNGLALITTAGFMQHRLNIYDKDKAVTQLRGDYIKGYDRLTNGMFIEQYAGYTYFAKNKLLNFTVGLDALIGFTRGRRDYLYDVMRPDDKQRIDILYGIRAGWYIPVFRRKSEDIIFE